MPNTSSDPLSDRKMLLDQLDQLQHRLKEIQIARRAMLASSADDEEKIKSAITAVQRRLKQGKRAMGVPLPPIFMRICEERLAKSVYDILLQEAYAEQQRQERMAAANMPQAREP